MPPMPPSPLLPPAAYHPYADVVTSQSASDSALTPAKSSMSLTILKLTSCPPKMSLTPPSHTLLTILMLLKCPQDLTSMPPPIYTLTTPYTSAHPPYLLCHLQSLRSPGTLKISLQHRPSSPCSPLLMPPLHHLPSLFFHIRSIGYGGLLEYTMNAITEIC
ncbi:hypothetical protein O181_043594 [Austropuccinia psidii MF-1]|uniref:Uncharacterized protein n=1 Tax=Austropuccinia psidii MF-1 TaxID=1389203 RepID=A0A9Q3DIL7_9BASI|nr:hypothetical protein [Austropuccinia psidii MF-1]